MIEVKHLAKAYSDHDILKDVSCTIRDGDVIAVIGPSGCGKSTFVRCLNLLEKPTRGEILFDGRDAAKGEISHVEVCKYAGMIFQNFNLYPQYTVLENIMVPQVDILRRGKQEAYDRAMDNLEMVGLCHAAQKYPDQLSGGQKQRVAIARTLAMDNAVLLMDEPTSALDPLTVREVQYVIRKLAKAGKTMVIVTHDMRFAREISYRVFFVSDGIIYEEGTPEDIFDDPQKEETRRFINCIHEKTLELTPSDFEFASCLSEIGEFAERSDLTQKQTLRIESLFEELISVNLLPKLSPDTKVHVRLSHSEKTAQIRIDASYAELFDPTSDIDPISRSIIGHNSESVHCTQSKSGETALQILVKS